MSNQVRRYVILMPNGMYSHGPSGKGVPLSKAKLWKQRGHVKTHLLGMPKNAYPKGCAVVELVLQESGNSWPLEELQEETKLRKEEREAESTLRWATSELERAQKNQPDLSKLRAKVRQAEEKLKEVRDRKRQ